MARVLDPRRWLSMLGALLLVSTVATPAQAVKLEAAPDYFVDLKLLAQPWMQLTNDPTAKSGTPDLTTDFFMRRTRIILAGQVSKWVSFFAETDTPNWGKGGDWTKPDFIIQDAFVTFNVHEAFLIDVGMILPPFVHQTRQGATSLHTLDYHTDVIKFPVGKGWRDAGIEFRGLLVNKKIDYRVSITNGAAGTEDDIPRFSGRVAYNFMDAEEAFFYGGTYLGAKKILSIGAGFDVQPDGVFTEIAAPAGSPEGTAATKDFGTYFAFGGDVFWDLPLKGGNRVSGQVDFVYYGGDKNPNQGMGLLFDIGYAIGVWEPIIAVDWFKPKDASEFKDQFLGAHIGLAWWLQGHNANVKLDLALLKHAGRDFGDASRVLTVQTQLMF